MRRAFGQQDLRSAYDELELRSSCPGAWSKKLSMRLEQAQRLNLVVNPVLVFAQDLRTLRTIPFKHGINLLGTPNPTVPVYDKLIITRKRG